MKIENNKQSENNLKITRFRKKLPMRGGCRTLQLMKYAAEGVKICQGWVK